MVDFFCIGAPKSGTTSLFNYLKNSKHIFLPPVKEPNFFASDIDPDSFSKIFRINNITDENKYFSKTFPNPEQVVFVRNEKNYIKLFSTAKPYQLKADFSTSYMYSKTAAKNIYSHNPNAKIIAILRHPVMRTYSHYLMAKRFGYVSGNFIDEIRKDLYRTKKGWGISELFIELSLYYEQLKRYYDVFPESNILIIDFFQFSNNTAQVLERVAKFLEIPVFSVNTIKVHNKAIIPKYPKINKLVTSIRIKQFIKKLPLNDFLKKKMFTTPNSAKITKSEYEYVLALVEEDMRKTASLTDISFDDKLPF